MEKCGRNRLREVRANETNKEQLTWTFDMTSVPESTISYLPPGVSAVLPS